MLKRKMSAVILAVLVTNLSANPIIALAETLKNTTSIEEGQQEKIQKAVISKFSLYGREELEGYNEIYRVPFSDVQSITNNGGKYSSSTIDKAIDDDFATHWETGTPNSDTFTNEVVINFNEITNINRVVYAARQSSTKGKGFAQELEIYASLTDDGDDFTLVCDGEYAGSTGDIVEIKFNSTDFKRLKFVFNKANQNWASASEFWFYNEDTVLDKMYNIFTDESKNTVSEEFNTIEKLEAFEQEASSHLLYNDIKEDIQNAKVLLTSTGFKYIDAEVSKFRGYTDNIVTDYDAIYKIPTEKITSITTNGGHYSTADISRAIDEEFNTNWHSGKLNSATHTNEVIITLDELTAIDRIMYTNLSNRGFLEEFEIYASKTTEGDTFEKITAGSIIRDTANIHQIKFNETEVRRIKVVFTKGYENWALISEIGLYSSDETFYKMDNIFTDESKNTLSEEFNSIEKLEAFEQEASSHPFYNEIIEDIENAKIILENKSLEYVDAKVTIFKAHTDELVSDYDNIFKLPTEKITSITTNGGQYSSASINRAIDEDFNTNWHSGKQNSETHTNEVTITLDDLTEVDRIMYTNLSSRGFLEEFEIYGSRTSDGDTFEKITEGSITRDTKNIHEIKFKETEVRRIKIVFTKGYENWALISELGLYTSDVIKEKMDRLFIDANMTEVNAEFDTIEAIENLIEAVAEHPFRDEYLEKLNIAKELVEFGQVIAGTSNVSKFEPFYTEYIENYDEEFRVNISGITNNGGKYGTSTIDKAIDEDADSHWETGSPNSDTFTNEVILTLEQVELISRLTYKSKVGGKGFAEEFSIYVSPVSSGDNFQKVTEGSYTVTNDMIEINFDEIKAKRVKFVFDKAYNSWASISDIRVYKEDAIAKEVKELFKDGLRDSLSEKFNSIEKVLELEASLISHPLKEVYYQDIQEAKAILDGTIQTVKTVVAEQQGNRNLHSRNTLKFGLGNDNQPTGIVAKPGDTIVVYVEVDPGMPLPKLAFSQQEGSFANWGRTVSLNVGKNVIEVPAVSQNDGWYHHSVTPGGAVYIVNPYTEEEQGSAPVIRFASGCETFPIMDSETDEDEFLEFLAEYKARVDADKEANPDVMDREVIDLVEIVSDHLVFTGTATGAYEAYINQGVKPSYTINMYNEHMDVIFDYFALDGSSEENDIKYTRENIRLAQPFGLMYAAGDHIGVQNAMMVTMLTSVGGWGVDHEIGHRMDIGIRTIQEVTNNMIPQYTSYFYNNPNRRIEFNKYTYKNVLATDNNEYYNGGYFEQLAVFWQIEMAYPGYWGKLNRLYRENNITLDSQNSALDKLNMLARYSGIAVEADLTEHFERHGFYVSDETKEILSQYEKPSIKMWYADYSFGEYEGEGILSDSGLEIKVDSQNDNVKLIFSVDTEYADDILGYEIFKGDELIGFTSNSTFVDTTTTMGENVNYTVIPYDKNLKTSKEVVVNSLIPKFKVQQEKIYIGLNEELNPLDLVKALTYNDEDISDRIKYESNVNSSEKGIYKIVYTVEDSGVFNSKTIEVEVVSEYYYLSDSPWTSVYTQYGTPRRNSNIKGRVNGDITEFDKGFYIHANGEIVYDLSGLDYDNFEALVGVDMNMAAQENSSITFKIHGDGVELASTNVIKHADDMVYINVPVKGVSELVIEITNGGNGNAADHGVIANPKLTTNNAKPTLNIPKSESTKLGYDIDIYGVYSAFDAEDGDLTSKVEVSGEVNFDKAGEYTLTYKVTDSDGNEVIKVRTIAVVDMNDFTYLTDYSWKSTSNSYTSPKIDKAVSGNDIRLTDDNGQIVTYERGIGAHSTSTIIYDLSDKNYDYFTAYVGVDRQMYGTVGSVTFEVWVDGEKSYDSGLMGSRDGQKYVEVDINGASELKLIVTDGGNGNGSDHASWGDTKLHYANENGVEINKASLMELIETVEALNSAIYTEESYSTLMAVLQDVKIQLEEGYTQDIINNLYINLNEAYMNLETYIDFNEVVEFKDKALKSDIKNALGLTSNEITIGDMYNLVTLECSGYVQSLEGIQYAVNLERLNIEFNEVSDLSPLKDLNKLTSFNGEENFILKTATKNEEDKYVINDFVVDIDGEPIELYAIVTNPGTGDAVRIDSEITIDSENNIIIDSSVLNGAKSIEIAYESKTLNYQLYVMYLLK